MKKAVIVTDLGPGEGGKGTTIHKVSLLMRAHRIIKVGGSQGSHGVRTSRGESFNFSHFGCGTFEGVRTHISSKMVIDPNALMYEGDLLRYSHSVNNAFELLTIDENALCVTPIHRIASRLRELSRKENPKGTVGVGVGEAVLDQERYPELAIRVIDIKDEDLLDKLEALRIQKIKDLDSVIRGNFFDQDRDDAIDFIRTLQDPNLSKAIFESFRQMISSCTIVGDDYLATEVLASDGVVVFESSHGVLTDRYHGFHPHTTQLRTVPQVSLDLLKECDYKGVVRKLGVTRGYQIRHGAGPMVTEDKSMNERLLPESGKGENRWQGKLRVGPLDLVALRYAINVCGGPEFFDGLAVTWFDQIQTLGKWVVCDKYTDTGNLKFFSKEKEMKVRRGTGPDQLEYQERLGKILRGCRPFLSSYIPSPHASREEWTQLCGGVLKEKLGIPIKMISFGPTEDDKICV